MVWLSVTVHLAVLAYAVRAVCMRMRLFRKGKDRRVPREDDVLALQVGFCATVVCFLMALIAQRASMWDMVEIMCVVMAVLAVRVLEHERRRHSRKTNEQPGSTGNA